MVRPPAADGPTVAPLSFQQEHVWRGPAPAAHTIPSIVVRLTGTVDVAALQRAMDAVVARHAALRTTFSIRAGAPEQRVVPAMRVPLATVDLTGWPAAEQELRLRALVDEANRPFDLTNEPLIRAGAVRMEASRHVVFVAAHHLVTDLWSTKVLMNELGQLYTALLDHRDAALPPLRVQYPEYAIWQRHRFRGEVLEAEALYWRARLDGIPSLSFDGAARGGAPSCEAASTLLPDNLTAAMKQLSRTLRTTPFVTLLAAFYVVAYGRTRTPRFLVDSLVANRDRAELEAMIGMFAGSVPLRGCVDESRSFADVVRDAQEDALSVYTHQHLPFRKIQELTLRGGVPIVSRPRVCFAFQAAPFRLPAFGGAEISAFDTVSTFTPTWDQWWQVVRRGAHTEIATVYRPQACTAESVRQLHAEYGTVLRSAVQRPDTPVGELLAAACSH